MYEAQELAESQKAFSNRNGMAADWHFLK